MKAAAKLLERIYHVAYNTVVPATKGSQDICQLLKLGCDVPACKGAMQMTEEASCWQTLSSRTIKFCEHKEAHAD